MQRYDVKALISGMTDYYEFLQISPNADLDTIHRVHRFLAARLHPDNPTGDPEKFKLLQTAYDVLSDRSRRAEYDMKRKAHAPQPLSETVDFMDSLEGETNRRLGLLAILYHRRRTNSSKPEVSLNEIEERMGFPRDYLDFTLGHLKGGMPVRDIDALKPYWDVCPQLKNVLFKPNRLGYLNLAVDKTAIKPTIYGHPEFTAFIIRMNELFAEWRD